MQLRHRITRIGIALGATAGAGLLALALAGPASASTAKPHLPLPFSDTLTLTSGGSTFVYRVHLHETPVGPWWDPTSVELITGTLRDTYEPVPISLPVYGVEFDHGKVVISVSYPTTGVDAGGQGVRTFSGQELGFGPFSPVKGTFTETGPNMESGPFTLLFL